MLGPVRLGSLKDVRVTPQCGVDDNRSRHPSGPGARPDPATSRHDARAILSPSALAEHANLSNILEKDHLQLQLWSTWTNNDKPLKAHLLKGHGVSHTSWRPLSAS